MTRLPIRSYSVEFSNGYAAEITIGGERKLAVGWTPDVPRNCSQEFLRSYKSWRDQCVADYCGRYNVTIAMVDL